MVTLIMTNKPEENRDLYRFEYFDPEDEVTYVDWVWLELSEINNYKSEYPRSKIRAATEEETNLYEEAYSDGYGIAAMLEFQDSYDGVTFRVELDEDGELDLDGKKMFECAVCSNHKDFEDEVAMSGDMFLGVLKDDKLWHICYECALLGSAIGNIQLEVEEDES